MGLSGSLTGNWRLLLYGWVLICYRVGTSDTGGDVRYLVLFTWVLSERLMGTGAVLVVTLGN